MFNILFERRGKQVVPTAANPLLGLLGTDTKSKTGIDVGGEEALSSTAVWSAVTQLSQSVASLPLHLYKWLKDGGKEKYKNHGLYRLLHLQPNPEMTAFAFREAQMGQILMAGTCFAEIERDRLDNIIGLWPLLTDRTETLRSKRNGELFYKYEIPGQEPKIFRKEAIFYG
jgi:HK97 family phage portal protein